MIMMRSILDVADNTGARRASMIGVLHRGNRRFADVGDIITCNIKEAAPDGMIKDHEVVKAVVVRTAFPLTRKDGTKLRFDRNAVVIIDDQLNPKGTRIFGPVARELRDLKFMKIISLAPEVL